MVCPKDGRKKRRKPQMQWLGGGPRSVPGLETTGPAADRLRPHCVSCGKTLSRRPAIPPLPGRWPQETQKAARMRQAWGGFAERSERRRKKLRWFARNARGSRLPAYAFLAAKTLRGATRSHRCWGDGLKKHKRPRGWGRLWVGLQKGAKEDERGGAGCLGCAQRGGFPLGAASPRFGDQAARVSLVMARRIPASWDRDGVAPISAAAGPRRPVGAHPACWIGRSP